MTNGGISVSLQAWRRIAVGLMFDVVCGSLPFPLVFVTLIL